MIENYNPDVLSCLANLSNDEVFTPPSVANKMLDMLPPELWKNSHARFLDPACKSGIFLREIAKRLTEGLADEIPDIQERVNHIFSEQLFGVAITEMTSLLSRRSLYCSKKADGKYSVATSFDTDGGNILFTPIKHTWQNGRCTFCGASQEVYERADDLESHAYQFIHTLKPQEIFNMKFDVIIGNPPYQLNDGGAQASAIPIYNKFVIQAIKLQPRYLCMIIPARWYAGGKSLNDFRNTMLNDTRITEIHDFPDASECFPGVEIKGGVCYFLWDKTHHGNCQISTHKNNSITSTMNRPLLERGCDTFIRQNQAIAILHKVLNAKQLSFSSIVHPAMTFGLRTYVTDFKYNEASPELTKVYANGCIGYIPTKEISSGKEYINKWKIIIPEASGIGDMTSDVLKPILSEPNSINTETYVMNGPYESKLEALNAISYIKTKFYHFLIGLKKITQHTTNKVYSFVPLQDFSHPWTDEMLYKKYGLTEDEIAFIESMIRPME